mgnify:CR=1 FL=1
MFARLFGRLRRRRQREDPWLDLPWEDKPEDMPDGTTNRRWCAETTDGRCSGHPDRRHGMISR